MKFPKSYTVVGIAIATLMVVLGPLEAIGATELPAPLQRCHLEDESCLIQLGYNYFTSFKKGIPEHDIPSIEPLELGEVRAINNGSLSFKIILSSTMLHKLAETIKVKSIKGFSKDLTEPMHITFDLTSPKLEIRASYDINGKMMIVPIVSKGEITINLSQIETKIRVTAVPEKHADGHYYLRITELKTNSKVGSGHINMSNWFNENKALHDSTLAMLNQQWNALSTDIQPKFMEVCDRAFTRVFQKLWDIFPYDAFFDDV